MKNRIGEKYCVGCEAWHFDRPKKQTFGELVELHQEIQLKPTDIQKVPKQLNYNKYAANQQVVQSLNNKLLYLSGILNTEMDIMKTKQILECMNLCMQLIKQALGS
jgi:hypothetical protein